MNEETREIKSNVQLTLLKSKLKRLKNSKPEAYTK